MSSKRPAPLLALFALALLSACGKTPAESLAGTWKGAATTTQGLGQTSDSTLTVVIEADGDERIKGSWQSTTGAKGTVNGVATKTKINPMTLTQSGDPELAFTGSATIDESASSLVGKVEYGTGTESRFTTTFTLIRQ